MDATKTPPVEPLYSPLLGCVIIGLAIIVLGGCAIFFIYQGTRMNREIGKFTESQPVARPVSEPATDDQEALHARIDSFAAAALAGEAAELSLGADDVNNLIATEDVLHDFRGNAFVIEIDGDFIVAEMSQQLNSLLPHRPRYLNATFHFRPHRHDDTLSLTLVDITAPDKEIPRGFIELYAQKQFFQLDPDNRIFGPVLKKIRQIEIRDGKIVASTTPPEDP